MLRFCLAGCRRRSKKVRGFKRFISCFESASCAVEGDERQTNTERKRNRKKQSKRKIEREKEKDGGRERKTQKDKGTNERPQKIEN